MKKNFWSFLILILFSINFFFGCNTDKDTLGPSSAYSPAPQRIDPIHLYNYYALHGNEQTFASYEDALAEYIANYNLQGLSKLRTEVKNLGLQELFEYIAGKMYEKGSQYYKINYKLTASQYFKKITQKLPTASYADKALYYTILCDISLNDYSDIIRAGKDLLTLYPSTNYKDYAYYSIGISFYKLEDYTSAKSYFTDLYTKFPKSKYADDAYFWLGQIAFAKKQYSKAYADYSYIIKNYPNSNYRFSAQKKIDAIVKENLLTF